MRYFDFIFRFYSLLIKAISNIHIPKNFRNVSLHLIGKHILGMRGDDFNLLKHPLTNYKTIRDFFIREIDLAKRPVHNNKIISPCDGKLIEYGNITNRAKLIQAKGKDYSLKKLLLNEELSKIFQEGSFFNLYLAPRNYHRFHIPCSGTIDYLEHIPGNCFPVNYLGQKIPEIYTRNERYIISITNNDFKLCMAIVGAAAVRGIEITKKKGQQVRKGELLGYFELGSSIIVICNKKLSKGNTVLVGGIDVFGPLTLEDLL